MIKEMNGWKVLIGANGLSGGNAGKYSVPSKIFIRYPANEMVYPKIKGSKLFFFKEKAHAEAFIRRGSYRTIVRCIAYNCSKPKIACNDITAIDQFWRLKNRKKKVVCSMDAPEGTWLAESIMCLE